MAARLTWRARRTKASSPPHFCYIGEQKDHAEDERMKATIYHNSNCGTSRKTLDILEQEGVEVTVVDYLTRPPAKEELKRLYERAGLRPSEGLRAKESLASDLDLLGGHVSENAILEAMIENPILIERPLVETEKGVRLCRPQERVREIL
jgi:arsenate reductase